MRSGPMSVSSVRFRSGEGRKRCVSGQSYLSRIGKIKRNRRDVANTKMIRIIEKSFAARAAKVSARGWRYFIGMPASTEAGHP